MRTAKLPHRAIVRPLTAFWRHIVTTAGLASAENPFAFIITTFTPARVIADLVGLL